MVKNITNFWIQKSENQSPDFLKITIAVEKLRDKLSPEDLAILNYLNNDHYSLVRKRVLDSGNEAMRDLSDLLENFNISLNDNNDIDFGNPDKNLIIHSKTRNNIYEEEK